MSKLLLCAVAMLTFGLVSGETEYPVQIVKLGSPEAAVREAAAKEIVGGLKDQIAASTRPYFKAVAESLNGEDAAKRTTATQQLATAFDTIRKVATQQYVEALKLLASTVPEEKKNGQTFFVENINNLLEREFVYGEIEKLGSTEQAVMEKAQKTLIELGGEAAPYIASSLDDEKPTVRRACFEILRLMGPAAKTAANDLQFLLDSDEKTARRSAGMLLEGLGADAVEVVDDLVMYLDHDEKSVRRVAANVLKKIGPAAKEAAGDLADLLESDDKHTRQLAVEVLMSMGPEAVGALETLTGTLDDANNDAGSRELAATVLASIGPAAKAALPVLKKYEKDADPVVKAAVEAAIKVVSKE